MIALSMLLFCCGCDDDGGGGGGGGQCKGQFLRGRLQRQNHHLLLADILLNDGTWVLGILLLYGTMPPSLLTTSQTRKCSSSERRTAQKKTSIQKPSSLATFEQIKPTKSSTGTPTKTQDTMNGVS